MKHVLNSPKPLTDEERAIYEWQIAIPDFGETGQQKLKGASVLISRLGGLGGIVAYELVAAGIGRLIAAHGGDVKPGYLNRQLLMTHDWIGKPRIESIVRRLKELNPRVEIVPYPENVNKDNVMRISTTISRLCWTLTNDIGAIGVSVPVSVPVAAHRVRRTHEDNHWRPVIA